MKRRDFLRGGVVITSFGIAEAANAQALVINPNLQNLLIRFCKPGTRTRRNVYTLFNQDPDHR
jgi:hypothetical protein